MAYLDPKNDLTFKKVFGEHPDLLKSLLNALLPLAEGQKVEIVEKLPVELTPVVPRFGNTLLDVRCADNLGSRFLVTIEMLWTDNFKARARLSIRNAYVKQSNKLSYDQDLQPVYALHLMNEAFQADLNIFYHHYPVVNIEDTEQQIKGLEFIFVELPHFKLPTLSENEMRVLWLRFLTEIEHGTHDASADLLQNKETGKALGLLQESAFSLAELEYYDRYRDAIAKERMIRDELIRRAIMQVKKEEYAKGETIGIEKGIEIGIKKDKIQIALKMIVKGFDDNTISEFTELTISEIQTLRQAGTLD